MKRVAIRIMTTIALLAGQAHAGNGDLIVDGTLQAGAANINGTMIISRGVLRVDSPNTSAIQAYTSGYSAQMSASSNGGQIYSYHSNTSTYQPTLLGVDGSNLNAGNIGIGTTNPQTKLHVGDSSYSGMLISFGSNTVASYGLGFGTVGPQAHTYMAANADYQLAAVSIGFQSQSNLGVNGYAPKLTVFNNGNVGIGTSNPNAKLDVAGNLNVSGYSYTSAGVWSGSDARFKKNLIPVNDSLNKVLSLNGLSYEWKTDEYKDKGFPEGRHYGVIAQEIEKVLPEVVSTAPDGTKAVAYTEIIPVLIEAIKEQQQQLARQSDEIREIKAALNRGN